MVNFVLLQYAPEMEKTDPDPAAWSHPGDYPGPFLPCLLSHQEKLRERCTHAL